MGGRRRTNAENWKGLKRKMPQQMCGALQKPINLGKQNELDEFGVYWEA